MTKYTLGIIEATINILMKRGLTKERMTELGEDIYKCIEEDKENECRRLLKLYANEVFGIEIKDKSLINIYGELMSLLNKEEIEYLSKF